MNWKASVKLDSLVSHQTVANLFEW